MQNDVTPMPEEQKEEEEEEGTRSVSRGNCAESRTDTQGSARHRIALAYMLPCRGARSIYVPCSLPFFFIIILCILCISNLWRSSNES